MVARLSSNDQPVKVGEVLKFFGGATKLSRDLLEAKIIDISRHAIQKWRHRGDIPLARRADLQALAKIQKRYFDITDYYKKKAA